MHDTIIIGELMSYLSFLIYMHDTIIIGGLMSYLSYFQLSDLYA